ncbi:MAG: hypothetical protein KatS3mg051_1197 [Anaerolineae bacterium]|nr:MAG: hypothetical protein KatS3mg051_1086 [Anaerolineae bacterium]GIV81843.1 MAG: hypothetical protein KatS3mg051_1197 [Anaerolineae bacterium]
MFTVELKDRSNAYTIVPSELSLRPRRWSDSAVGGPDSAVIDVAGPREQLVETLRWLGYEVTIRNELGTPVWWGVVNDVEVSLGGLSIGLSLDDMANRVAVAYTATNAGGADERGTTAWADDATSQDRYGTRELLVSAADTDSAAAAKLRDRVLAERKQPIPALRVESGDSGATIRCVGYWQRLGWQYYQQLAGVEEHTDIGNEAQPIGAHYTATTISFSEPGGVNDDDIYDSANGLGFLSVGDVFTVEGSASNNGTYTTKSAGAGNVETVERLFSYEAAGAEVSIGKGKLSQVRINKVAQSFTLSVNASWAVAYGYVHARRVGNPADNLKLSIYSDSSGSPGSLLVSATVAGSSLSTKFAWVEFNLGSSLTLSYGTTYWLVVERDGAKDPSNYYEVALDEDLGYSGGALKVFNGYSWINRSTDADMPFRLVGREETTSQLSTMLNSSGFITGVDILDSSGVSTWQYRAGDSTILEEAESLLSMGNSTGKRLLATVTPEKRVRISVAPDQGDIDLAIDADGIIENAVGGRAEPGQLIAGRWLQAAFSVPLADNVAPVLPLFVERSEYNVSSAQLSVEAGNVRSPWDVGRGRQG